MLQLEHLLKCAQKAIFLLPWLSLCAAPSCIFASRSEAPHPPTVAMAPSAQAAEAMRAETRYVVHCLEQIHYARAPIANLNMGEFIEEYISKFDPHHLFLLQNEVDALKGRFAGPMPFYLRQGNLFPAFEIFNVYQNCSNKRLDWTMKRLDGPFDFTSKDTFVPDRRKLPWPKDAYEADLLWEKRLKYELLIEMLSDEEQSPAQAPTPMACWKQLEKFLQDLTNPLHGQPFLYGSFLCRDFYDAPACSTQDFRYGFKHPADQTAAEKLAVADAQSEQRAIKDLSTARKVIKERYERYQKSLRELEPSEIEEIFLTNLTQMYDPHSTFYSADSMEDFSIAMRNSLVGIGAVLTDEEGICTVRELIAGGPAEHSGEIKPGDKIVAIAQGSEKMVDVVGMKLRKVVKLIRGPKGTELRLLIQPAEGDPSSRRTVILVRDDIALTTRLAEGMLYKVPANGFDKKIGVIDLPTFYGPSDDADHSPSTAKDVEELIKKLKDKGMQGLILDLRRNGGGLLNEAIDLTGLFIQTGPVLQVKDSMGQLSEFVDTNSSVTWNGPLVILMSRYSASASEIVIGSLKDHDRALIVGDPNTHGKGTVQAVLDIDRSMFARLNKPKLGATKITVQKWYLPDGGSTQLEGVPADISFPSLNPYLPIGESDLPHALSWDCIHALPWAYMHPQVDAQLIETLKTSSIARQSSLNEMIYLQRNVDWYRAKQEQKEFFLNLREREAQKREDRRFQRGMEHEYEGLVLQKYACEKILLNSAIEVGKAEKQKNSDEDVADKPFDESQSLEDAFDIHLREALRIMTDWVELIQEQKASSEQVQPQIAA